MPSDNEVVARGGYRRKEMPIDERCEIRLVLPEVGPGNMKPFGKIQDGVKGVWEGSECAIRKKKGVSWSNRGAELNSVHSQCYRERHKGPK